MTPRRICVIVPTHLSYQTGGAQYQADLLVEALIRRDNSRVVFLSRRIDRDFKPQGYVLESVSRRSGGIWSAAGHVADSADLYARLMFHQPELIYQRVGGAFTAVAAYYAKRHGARFTWHVAHDHDVTPGKLAARGWKIPLLRQVEKRMLEYGIRRADTIVAQTEEQRRRLERFYGRGDAIVVPNFHPPPRLEPDKSGPRQVLWVANFKKWKRPEAFIRLAESLSHLRSIRFVMIGAPSGNHDWQRQLESRIGRARNIDYLGEQSLEVVNESISRSHLFINTSEAEGFANTFVQAWFRQVPVLSLSVDPDGVLERERIGMLCGTEERLRESVERLCSDERLRADMGQRAQAYAHARHSTANVDRLVDIVCGASAPTAHSTG
jgi:glycosyltransferase involved in cell wall biosynthesis